MVLALIQQGLGRRPREKRALCGKMSITGSRQGHFKLICVNVAFEGISSLTSPSFYNPFNIRVAKLDLTVFVRKTLKASR